jgi:hypothetical protein
MRPRVLLSVALLLCSCSPENDRAPAGSATDSGAVVTELNSAADSNATSQPTKAPASSLSTVTLAGPSTKSSAKAPTTPVVEPPQAETDFRCGIRNAPVLTSLGIGNLQVGRTIDVVKRTCRVVRDTPEMDEGGPERVLTVVIDNDRIRVTVHGGLVWRLDVTSSRFVTRDGLRVGTSLSRLAARGGVHLQEDKEGLYVTLASHCGLSFHFAIPSRERPGKAWTVAHVVQRYGSAVADKIVVSRCTG